MADQDEWQELGEEGSHDPRSNQQTPGEYPQEGSQGHHSHQASPAQEGSQGHRSNQASPAHEGSQGHRSNQQTPGEYPQEGSQGRHSQQASPAHEGSQGHRSNQQTPGEYPQEVSEEHRSHQASPAHEGSQGHRSNQQTPGEYPQEGSQGRHSHQASPAHEGHEGHEGHARDIPVEGHHEHPHDGHPGPHHKRTDSQNEEWRQIGEDQSEQPQEEEQEREHEGHEHHEHEPHQALYAHEHEQEREAPQENAEEWKELGEEDVPPAHAEEGEREPEGVYESEEVQEEGGQPVLHEVDNGQEAEEYPEEHAEEHRENTEEYPADEQAPEDRPEETPQQEEPQEEEYRELGDEEAAPAHAHEHEHEHAPVHKSRDIDLSQPPQNAERDAGRDRDTYRKPRQNTQSVARWEPSENQHDEDSGDEFELSTCMAPVYEGEGEEGNEDAPVYKNGSPDFKGDTMSCFDEPNVLYRIVERDEKESTWAFYNDSTNYECHVEFTFGKNSKLEALENTTLEQNDKGEFVAAVVVYPTETEMFVKGKINGFTSKLRAAPLSDDYHHTMSAITQKTVQQEQDAINQVAGGSQNAEEVLAHCLENNIMFVDPEFPPTQASLDTGAKKPMKPLAWARPQMYLPEEMASQVRLFRSVPAPGQVDAGELGDSWVMCSVASVSEDPKRLLGMFRHPEGKEAAQREHAIGAYRVTFSKNGWWRTVVVDSYLPVSGGKPKYAKSMKDPAEIWPCILEKAYAKLHGSYAKIITGDPLHALNDMTGFSTLRFDEALSQSSTKTRDEDELFTDLIRGVKAGYTVIVNTPGKDPKASTGADADLAEQFKSVGLLTGHAYTILDAKEFPDHNIQIVKIRNAWGHGIEWNGDWGDDDERWAQFPEIAEECNFQKANDGTFWMTWEEVQKYFNGGGICFSHEPAYDYRINSAFNEGVPSCVLEIEVNSPTWFTFVIAQEDKRTKDDADYEYQPVMLSVAQPEDESYHVLFNSTVNGVHPSPDKWTFLQGRDVSLINKLDAGKYLVVPRILASNNLPDQVPYVLGVIANKEVGTGDVEVSFKTIDGNSRVFENFPKFTAELAQPEDVQFQKRPPGAGFPATLSGERLE